MNILFITSAHNSLSQRLLVELTTRGHAISVCIAADDSAMFGATRRVQPDLIIAPMLKRAIPEQIWTHHTCLIVHPGIKGDRGPSSLDWAITRREAHWGVTVLQAVAEMDAGPIWAARTFPLGDAAATKSCLYRYEVTEAAVQAVLEAVRRFATGTFVPAELDYSRVDITGELRPTMKQADRALDWRTDDTDTIIRKINAADSAPGLLDTVGTEQYYLYGACEEQGLRGDPGMLLAQRHGAVCRATVDGAVWFSHAKTTKGRYAGIKLPASKVLGDAVLGLPHATVPINVGREAKTYREIRYREEGPVGFLEFEFYNGAMSTEQCYRLRNAFLYARSRPTKVIVLLGGPDLWSNGIHLNLIEAAADPAVESWKNIVAIDDLIFEFLNTLSHLLIAGIRGNAGAGGAMLALAADHVCARSGVVLNPHYRSMGGLYGSEYWTYTLPKRVGKGKALEITEGCQAMGTQEALAVGFIDAALSHDRNEFELELADRARTLATDSGYWMRLREKSERRFSDERLKPLASYRKEELRRMRQCFYAEDSRYHEARHRFVHKQKGTPALVDQPTRVFGKYGWSGDTYPAQYQVG